MPYVAVDSSLPRSLDVQISLSRAQTESRTNLTIPVVVCEDLGFFPDSNRIRFYSTLPAVEADFATETEAWKAANAFFAQSPRSTTMAIGEAFLTPQPAYLAAGVMTAAQITALQAVTNGEFTVTYNPTGDVEDSVTQTFSALDFHEAATLDAIIVTLQAKAGSGLRIGKKTIPGGSVVLTITPGIIDGDVVTYATGDGVTITHAAAVVEGEHTDCRALLNLTVLAGAKRFNGYTPDGITGELTNIQNSANAQGKFLYGWVLEAGLRSVATQAAAATWALGRVAMMPLVTNELTALDVSYDQDLASIVAATGNKRAACIYHDNVERYPDMSILAYMLSVNYAAQASTVTAKFKTLPGIETVTLTESQWSVLQHKGYNTYTLVGNSARTFRNGVTEDSNYYLDSTINLDNFVEDLSVNVYNVFLRNKKIPYTTEGQLLLVDACTDTCQVYVYNNTFAERPVADTTKKAGFAIVPAFKVTPTPLYQATAADRANRIAPPISITVMEAGAIHSVAINVEVVA